MGETAWIMPMSHTGVSPPPPPFWVWSSDGFSLALSAPPQLRVTVESVESHVAVGAAAALSATWQTCALACPCDLGLL